MSDTHWRVGLVVNPIAGIGGRAGLKGSDGDRAALAAKLGVSSQVPGRVTLALEELARIPDAMTWFCAAGAMGADVLQAAGIEATTVHATGAVTTADDTRNAVKQMLKAGIDLLLFAGGDGTARDVMAAAGERVPVLGIPAGVKMHSAVFALTPRTAGVAARRFFEAGGPERFCALREVMDREFLPDGQPASSPRLYGHLQTLEMPTLVQASKATTAEGGDASVLAALGKLARELLGFDCVLLGPGATLYALKAELGFVGTLLGVDVFCRNGCLVKDAREDQIFDAIQGQNTCLVLGIIGGQGFLLGRGNQQLSGRVLRAVGTENLRIVASAAKLTALRSATIYVDTGDEDVDAMLAGYHRVITAPRRSMMCRVAGAADLVNESM